jgi:hypothetical protein
VKSSPAKQRDRKSSGQTVFLYAVVALCIIVACYMAIVSSSSGEAGAAAPVVSRLTLEQIPFDGRQAYEYLKQLCDLGPRPSGSETMKAQQRLLEQHFRGLGATVQRQEFAARHPRSGQRVHLANLIIQWHPDRQQRILLAAHYDTRPLPDRDPVNPEGTFIGANDGASGVAVLMELGRHMASLQGKMGVDFVLFDGEELVYRDRDPYFLGSEYFARDYVANPPAHRYRWGVLLDMVGDANLMIEQEGNSASWRDTRPLVQEIWGTAKKLGVFEFVFRKGVALNDDHLALRNVAKIPTCDIIDFDYPAWHTENDVPQQCSALSLAKVGWVIHEWLAAKVKTGDGGPAIGR